MTKLRDLTGMDFGRLKVKGRGENGVQPNGNKYARWECVCDCGKCVIVSGSNLKSGATRSCGCYRKEIVTKLGMSDSKVYAVWAAMKQRCSNTKDANYTGYGGRGITYDPKWETFEGFWEDMEEGYEDELTLDRRDNDKGYCKDNCRWVKQVGQVRNTRKYRNNTSGKTGVTLHKKHGAAIGYVSQWRKIDGKDGRKFFSFKKYGEELALLAASEYRDKQLLVLNLLGAGYTEGHGL